MPLDPSVTRTRALLTFSMELLIFIALAVYLSGILNPMIESCKDLYSFLTEKADPIDRTPDHEILRMLKQKLIDLTNRHLDTLHRKFHTLTYANDYGVVETNAWDREFVYFFDSVLLPAIESFEEQYPEAIWLTTRDELRNYIKDGLRTSFSASSGPRVAATVPTDPVEFEEYCATVLINQGFDAHLTGRSGDQGCDVVAEYLDKKLIIQCKLYFKPVGNKAVQEVFAAKGYYNGSHAAVVSNSGYTKSAKDLARSLNVYLLSPHDLWQMEGFVWK